jgi:hypothetical protein
LRENEAGVERIQSGGQTGVDRAALDVALRLGIPCGGWCPRGRLAEDGPIPDRYPLIETPSADYAQRTEWNVRDSDATLILFRGSLKGGSALTERLAAQYGRPCLTVDLGRPVDAAAVRGWLREKGVRVLNVAGPRKSDAEDLYAPAATLLLTLLSETGDAP